MSQTRTTYRIAKRILDLAVAVPALLVCSPVLFLIALAVRIDVGSPVLWKEQRPGLHGRPFTLLKFRTMADRRDSAGSLLPDADRLTRFGKFLRSTSLDELPELWNILMGRMSLVGPRPLMLKYLNRYTPEQLRRHDVPPGLTGWAQVRGRNSLTWEEKFAFDLWYVDHCSFALDLKIILITFGKLLRREGITAEGHVTAPEYTGPKR